VSVKRGAITLTLGLAAIAFSLKDSFAAEADLPEKQTIVLQLQQAVRADDKAWLAAHTRYPLSYFGRGNRVIGGKAAFIRNYALLFGAKLRAAILAQDPATVFENWQGLMVGEGRYNVWVRDTSDGGASRYQIVAINGS
jgi:hypothetical protein